MSAKAVICLIAIVCLLATVPSAVAYETSEYLKIVEIREVVDDRGYVDFVGVVQNTHPYLAVEGIQVVLTFKKDDLVIDVIDGLWCSNYSTDKTCEFEYSRSRYTKDDYDSVTGRIASSRFYLSTPDPWLLTGELSLVEASLSVRADDDGWIVVVGELHNGTNAMLNIEHIAFGLWDAEENFLGWADDSVLSSYAYIRDVLPGETVSFLVGNRDIPFDRVARYRIDVEYSISRYIDQSIATTVDGASWGEIKAMGRR